MSRKGENIYKRKDGRWEGRYIKGYDSNNKAIYGYVYAKSYREVKNKMIYYQIIYVFLTIFLYLLKCPQSLILSALRAFCFCGKPHISRSIFLYFRYQAWLKSW